MSWFVVYQQGIKRDPWTQLLRPGAPLYIGPKFLLQKNMVFINLGQIIHDEISLPCESTFTLLEAGQIIYSQDQLKGFENGQRSDGERQDNRRVMADPKCHCQGVVLGQMTAAHTSRSPRPNGQFNPNPNSTIYVPFARHGCPGKLSRE